jgi:hypothetical protein
MIREEKKSDGSNMAGQQDPTPVPGAAAYARQDRNARLTQAAIVLSIGAAAAGDAERVDRPTAIGLPADIAALGRPEPIPLAEAVAPLGITTEEQRERRGRSVTSDTRVALMDRLVADPNPIDAAALVEACLHSEDRLVRTSAAVAALDTTGPRDDVVAQLVDGASRGRGMARDIGRIGLSRVDPSHPTLRRAVGRPSPRGGTDRPSHTAFLTHGTFAALTTWWRPGGDFYVYLDSLTPSLHLHDPSFGWSGLYSDGARRLAAQQMVDWVADQGLHQPDLFAHSHGGTVGNLATGLGLQLDRLVLLSWPVHPEWFPDFARVQRIIDIRVRLDLVILADRGGQTFTPPPGAAGKVTSHVNGWFQHSDTHEPSYWNRYGLAAVL